MFAKIKKMTIGSGWFDEVGGTPTGAGATRLRWLKIAAVTWWTLSLLLALLVFCIDGIAIIAVIAKVGPVVQKNMGLGWSLLFGYLGNVLGLNIILDLWVIAALRWLRRVWVRQMRARVPVETWKIATAMALVFGRIGGFFWSFVWGLIPNSWWLLWPVKFGVLPPVLLLMSGFAMMMSLYLSAAAGVLFLYLIPMKIFGAVAEILNKRHMVNVELPSFLEKLRVFWFWFTGRQMPYVEPEPDDTKGARFATRKEIAALYDPEGAAFGHINGAPMHVVTDKHVLIKASTRSGKGVTLIIPHLLRYPGSAFVLDPKGENAKATGRQRARLNNKVHYLDPFGISGKPQARFNPLSRFTLENMEAESKALAAALVIEGGKRDHWTGGAQQLLVALLAYVFASPDIPPGQKDLPYVRRLLLAQPISTLKIMEKTDLADGLVANLAASFLNTPPTELGNIISTAQRETEILDNPFICACLAASGANPEVDFADWHTGTMTVFLCLSAPKFPTFNRWLRLVLVAALDEMTDILNPPPLPVCFMLDELATLGHLQVVENAVGLAAGYGVQIFSVFQDLAQMKDLYQGRWASFVGNAGVRAVFSLDDYDTANYWSKFLGGRLVETRSESQDVYGLTKGQSKGETMRPLLTPEEIMRQFAVKKKMNGRPIEQEQMLVLAQGSRPVVTTRVPYYEDDSLKGLWDDPREKTPSVSRLAPVPPAAPKVPPKPAPVSAPAAQAAPKATPASAAKPAARQVPQAAHAPVATSKVAPKTVTQPPPAQAPKPVPATPSEAVSRPADTPEITLWTPDGEHRVRR